MPTDVGAELLEVAEPYCAVRADRVVVVRLRHVLVQQVDQLKVDATYSTVKFSCVSPNCYLDLTVVYRRHVSLQLNLSREPLAAVLTREEEIAVMGLKMCHQSGRLGEPSTTLRTHVRFLSGVNAPVSIEI